MSKFITATLDGIEITRAKGVKKHGDHDQSTHGNWAYDIQVAPEVVSSVLSRVKENGGLSVKMTDGSEPTKGFMVAKGAKYGAVVKADDFYDPEQGAKILADYMKRHKADLATGKNYLGLWHNTADGQVYLDVSENIEDEAEATARGRERDQISIWDVANFKEIDTGGTGSVGKTRNSKTSRYLEHDGRGNREVRSRDLRKTSKTIQVIRFDYGLKPVIKHGEHDQSSHGDWARGFTDSERSRIEAMDSAGPSIEDLDNVIKDQREVDDDEIRMMVENDRDLYDAIQERVQERLADREYEISQMSENEKIRVQEQMTEMVTNEYIDDNRDELAERARIESGDSGQQDPAELQPYFDEVYSVTHTGKNTYGDEVTLSSTVEEVYRDGKDIIVSA